jgi:hypothetical protein
LVKRILPLLPSGLSVHCYDIFPLEAYPMSCATSLYNEQSTVAKLLKTSGWKIEFSSAHTAHRLVDAIELSVVGELPLIASARESSFWLRKR